MSMFDHSIRFPLAAAMLAAMGGASAASGVGCGDSPFGAVREVCGPSGELQRVLTVDQVPGPVLSSIESQLNRFDGVLPVDAGIQSSADEYLSFEANGETMYVGETVIRGRRTAVEVRASGEVSCVEVEVPQHELPAAVKRMSDAETGSYPTRAYWKKLRNGETTFVVNAKSSARSKHLELDAGGRVLSSEMVF